MLSVVLSNHFRKQIFIYWILFIPEVNDHIPANEIAEIIRFFRSSSDHEQPGLIFK